MLLVNPDLYVHTSSDFVGVNPKLTMCVPSEMRCSTIEFSVYGTVSVGPISCTAVSAAYKFLTPVPKVPRRNLLRIFPDLAKYSIRSPLISTTPGKFFKEFGVSKFVASSTAIIVSFHNSGRVNLVRLFKLKRLK